MKLTINGKEIEAARGETVLKAARRAGVDIPHLCSLDWAPSPAASCRMCVVEVEGNPRLLTSCTLEAAEGMAVHTHTPRVLKARRAIMELLIASHPQDCLSCVRGGDCELAALAGDLGVRRRRYVGAVKQHPVDISSPALWRDPNKCVLCGRCVTVCHDVQGVGAIDFTGRGFKTRIAPGFAVGLNVSECVYCGQCARVCPTGAIVERDQVDDVVAALADPDAVVVAQVAPAVPATLLEGHSKSEGVRVMLERLAAALKRVGFDAVFDTSFAADLTIMEEGSELLDRIAERRRAAHVHQLLSRLGELRRDAPPRPDPAPLHLQEPAADGRRADPRDLPEARGSRRQAPRGGLADAVHRQEVRGAGPQRRGLRAHHARARAPVGPLRRRVRALHRAGAAGRAVRGGHRRRSALRRQRRRDGGGRAHGVHAGRR